MRITGDAYFDGANLMDIQVMSTLGITEDDIDAIEKVDGVELAEGSYSSDFYVIRKISSMFSTSCHLRMR